MSKLNFVFLCAVYITISILSFSKSINEEILLICCGSLIALIGIPHGSIDHIIFMEGKTIKPYNFYFLYIGIMILYAFVWYLSPMISILIFIFISAYHFGESQLTKVLPESTYFKPILYLAWGVNILAALVLYNFTEVLELFDQYHDAKPMLAIFNVHVYKVITIATTFFLLGFGFYAIKIKNITWEVLLQELYILTIIHISFILLPLLLGFTLYFIILHSLKVLIEEYDFLDFKFKNINLKFFISKLFPLTIISILGSLVLVGLIYYEVIYMSYLLLFTILISIITLPHSIIMNSFYKKKLN